MKGGLLLYDQEDPTDRGASSPFQPPSFRVRASYPALSPVQELSECPSGCEHSSTGCTSSTLNAAQNRHADSFQLPASAAIGGTLQEPPGGDESQSQNFSSGMSKQFEEPLFATLHEPKRRTISASDQLDRLWGADIFEESTAGGRRRKALNHAILLPPEPTLSPQPLGIKAPLPFSPVRSAPVSEYARLKQKQRRSQDPSLGGTKNNVAGPIAKDSSWNQSFARAPPTAGAATVDHGAADAPPASVEEPSQNVNARPGSSRTRPSATLVKDRNGQHDVVITTRGTIASSSGGDNDAAAPSATQQRETQAPFTVASIPDPSASLLASKQHKRSSLSAPISEKYNFVALRLLPANDALSPRSHHTVTALRTPRGENYRGQTEPPEVKLVLVGGNVKANSVEGVLESVGVSGQPRSSEVVECELSPEVVFENKPIEWSKIQLEPPIELLKGHSCISLDGLDKDKCILFGGSQSNSLFGTLYVVDISTRQSYASITSGQQPASRAEHSCVIKDTRLYVFGGRPKAFVPSLRHREDVAIFPGYPTQSQSPTGKSDTVSVATTSMAANEGGGSSPSCRHLLQPAKVLGDLWKLDLTDFEWTQVPMEAADPTDRADSPTDSGASNRSGRRSEMAGVPCSRAGHAAVQWQNQMWIYGGFNGEVVLDDIWRLNLETETWSPVFMRGGRGGGCRYAAASCLVNDVWMLHGGISSHGSLLNDFYLIDLVTLIGSRLRINVSHTPRRVLPSLAFHSLVSVPLSWLKTARPSGTSPHREEQCQLVYLIGGYGKSGQCSNSVYHLIRRDWLPEIASHMNPEAKKQLLRAVPAAELEAAGVSLGGDVMQESPHTEDVSPPASQFVVQTRAVPSQPAAVPSVESQVVTSQVVTPPSLNCIWRPLKSTAGSLTQQEVEALSARVAYLADRLKEQKTENLRLRTLTKEASLLKKRLRRMEQQLLQFELLRAHPLLGPVLQACLKGLLKPSTSQPRAVSNNEAVESWTRPRAVPSQPLPAHSLSASGQHCYTLMPSAAKRQPPHLTTPSSSLPQENSIGVDTKGSLQRRVVNNGVPAEGRSEVTRPFNGEPFPVASSSRQAMKPRHSQVVAPRRCVRCLSWSRVPVRLIPCGHWRFCENCAQLGLACPACGVQSEGIMMATGGR